MTLKIWPVMLLHLVHAAIVPRTLAVDSMLLWTVHGERPEVAMLTYVKRAGAKRARAKRGTPELGSALPGAMRVKWMTLCKSPHHWAKVFRPWPATLLTAGMWLRFLLIVVPIFRIPCGPLIAPFRTRGMPRGVPFPVHLCLPPALHHLPKLLQIRPGMLIAISRTSIFIARRMPPAIEGVI